MRRYVDSCGNLYLDRGLGLVPAGGLGAPAPNPIYLPYGYIPYAAGQPSGYVTNYGGIVVTVESGKDQVACKDKNGTVYCLPGGACTDKLAQSCCDDNFGKGITTAQDYKESDCDYSKLVNGKWVVESRTAPNTRGRAPVQPSLQPCATGSSRAPCPPGQRTVPTTPSDCHVCVPPGQPAPPRRAVISAASEVPAAAFPVSGIGYWPALGLPFCR